MPVLGTLLTSIFGGLTTILTAMFGAQMAVRLAAVAAFLTFTTVLSVAFNLAVSPLVAEIFNHPFGQVAGLAFPPIAGTCVATMGLVWSACALYTLQRRALGMLSG